MKKVKSTLMVLMFLLVISFSAQLFGVDAEAKHILVIHSFYSDLTTTREINRGIEEWVSHNKRDYTFLHFIYLDVTSDFAGSPLHIVRKTVQRIELIENIDNLIIVDRPAFDVMSNKEFASLHDTPTVILSTGQTTLEEQKIFTNSLILNEEINTVPTIKLALDLFPDSKQVEIISNNKSLLTSDSYYQIVKSLRNFSLDIKINITPSMNLMEYKDYINQLNEETVIITSQYVHDDNPNTIVEIDILYHLLKKDNLHLFSTYKHSIDKGIIGGYVVDFRKLGSDAMVLLKDLSGNDKLLDIAKVSYLKNSYVFDIREVKKKGIDFKKLPAQAQFIHKREPIDKHLLYSSIILATLLTIFSTLLFLLYQRLKRGRVKSLNLTKQINNLEQIANLTDFGSWRFDRSTNLLHLSETAQGILALSNGSQTLSAEEIKSFLPHQDIDKLLKVVNSKESTNTDRELTIVTSNGEQKRCSVKWSHRNLDNGSSEIFGVLKDVSQALMKEQKNSELFHINKLMVKTSSDGKLFINAKDKIEWINFKAKIILSNYSKQHDKLEEFDIIITKLIKEFPALIKDKTKRFPNIIKGIYLSETDRYIDIRADKVYESSTIFKGLLITITDITKEKNQVYHNNKCDQFRNIIQTQANIYNWEWDISSKLFSVTSNWYISLGLKSHERAISLESMKKIILPEHNKNFYTTLANLTADDNYGINEQLKIYSKDNQLKWYQISGSLLQKSPNEIRVIGIMEEITYKVVLEAKIKELETKLNTSENTIEEMNKNFKSNTKELTETFTSKNLAIQTQLDKIMKSREDYVKNASTQSLKNLVIGLSQQINSPLALLSSCNDNLALEFSSVLKSFNEIVVHLNKEHIELIILAIKEIEKNINKVIAPSERRSEQLIIHNYLSINFSSTPYQLSKLIVMLGFQNNIKLIKPLLNHADNNRIFTFLLGVSNIIKLSKHIDEAVKDLSHIVYALKRFSRFETNQQKQKMDVRESIELALDSFSEKSKLNIEINKDYDNISKIPCYPSELHLLWVNLIENAMHSVSIKGKLEITIKDMGENLLIAFRDNGVGIADDIKEKIFDPFFTTKKIGIGIGIGLDIANTVVRNHDAKLSFVSKFGDGSTFTVLLPKDDKDK